NELSTAKDFVYPTGSRAPEKPIGHGHQREAQEQSNHGRKHNKLKSPDPDLGLQQAGNSAIRGNPRAGITSEQGMRARGWQSQIPGDQVPDDGAEQSTKQ